MQYTSAEYVTASSRGRPAGLTLPWSTLNRLKQQACDEATSGSDDEAGCGSVNGAQQNLLEVFKVANRNFTDRGRHEGRGRDDHAGEQACHNTNRQATPKPVCSLRVVCLTLVHCGILARSHSPRPHHWQHVHLLFRPILPEDGFDAKFALAHDEDAQVVAD
jgi:hypothetical protein